MHHDPQYLSAVALLLANKALILDRKNPKEGQADKGSRVCKETGLRIGEAASGEAM